MNALVKVALSLGSNIDRYRHINAGLNDLEAEFGSVLCSPVYESASVGFDGSPFLNLIAVIETPLSLSDVIKLLKQIEDRNGRDRSGPKFGPRTLDIDVVTYGEHYGELEGVQLPRAELYQNAFVLLPMVDLWPQQSVPGESYTYAQLWAKQDQQQQQLAVVRFNRQA